MTKGCDQSASYGECVHLKKLDFDLKSLKVKKINCDGWIVPPPVEKALKELFKKHNALVEYLSPED